MTTPRILIVDDAIDVRRMIRAALETLGRNIQILDVPSGEEAMLVMSRKPVDIMILDVRLAGISGLEVLSRAKNRNPKIKQVLITGLTDPKIRQQVAESGADAYFYKPVPMGDFLNTIEGFLGGTKPISVEKIAEQPTIKPATPQKSPAKANSPVERLDHLRQEVQVVSAAILDDHGFILEQSGDLPDECSNPDFSSLLVTTCAASLKASKILGGKPARYLNQIPGTTFDCFLVPVEPAFILFVVAPASMDEDVTRKLIHSLRSAAMELPALMVAATPQAKSAGVAGEEIAQELDQLLGQVVKESFKREEVDAFWDNLIEQGDEAESVSPPGAFSYEEARKLGLAPEQNG